MDDIFPTAILSHILRFEVISDLVHHLRVSSHFEIATRLALGHIRSIDCEEQTFELTGKKLHRTVAQHCQKLSTAVLHYDRSTTHEELLGVVQSCRSMTSLKIIGDSGSENPLADDTVVNTIAQCLPKIRTISCVARRMLLDGWNLTGPPMSALARGCQDLRSLKFVFDFHSEHARVNLASGILDILKSCKKLEALSLQCCIGIGMYFTSEGLLCPALKNLSLRLCALDDECCDYIGITCPNLEALTISYNRKITIQSVEYLRRRNIDLHKFACKYTGINIDIEQMRVFFPNVEELN